MPRSSAEAPAASTPPPSSKRLDPVREITVYERNAPDDTFGFGVVLSDETLGGIEHADPVVHEALKAQSSVRWDDIDVVHRGTRHTSGGHRFAALGRRRLLGILHDRCRDLGVDLRLRTEAPPPELGSRGPTTSSSPPTECTAPPASCTATSSARTSPRPLPLHLARRRLRLRRLPLRDRRDLSTA
ncbi:hypothetical protein SVIOM342S_06100 [Streptomyces violaceorubidus]